MPGRRTVHLRTCQKPSKKRRQEDQRRSEAVPNHEKRIPYTPRTNNWALANAKMPNSDMGTRSHDKTDPKPLATGPLGTPKVVISLRTSSKNEHWTQTPKSGGSTKYGGAKPSLEDAKRPPTPPQRGPKTMQEAPREAAHTTSEAAKSVTA